MEQEVVSLNIEKKVDAFRRILLMMDELRAKCPWDRKQTLESLRHLTIEETYELVDAITDADLPGIKEELGDIMLHLVFYSKIGEEKGAFDIEGVINQLCDKMESRHPHIYGDAVVADEEEVLRNWEQLKMKEGKKSALEGVPKSLPALIKSLRIQEKAKKVGFEWDTTEQVWDKVKEEIEELEEAVLEGDQNHIEEEYGDVLFSFVNYARFLKVDPENALERCNKKFMARFMKMEEQVLASGRQMNDLNLKEMDAIWDEVKKDIH